MLSTIATLAQMAPALMQTGKMAYDHFSGDEPSGSKQNRSRSSDQFPSFKGRKQAGFFQDQDPSLLNIEKFTPDQREVLNNLLRQGMAGQQQAMQPIDFSPMIQQSRRQFQQQTLPDVMQQYLGSGGIGRHSGLGNQMAQAAADFEQNLHSNAVQQMIQQRQMQSQMAQNMMNLGLQPQFEQIYQQGRPSEAKSGLVGFIKAVAPHLLDAFTKSKYFAGEPTKARGDK